VTTTDVDYTADGSVMIGRLALPEGDDRRPAVLIAHEGGGLDEYQKSRAERFAGLGYVAFALDYYGHGTALTSQEDMAARCQALWLAPERIRALAGAGLDVLLAEPRPDASRVAAVGYCFGGALVLELARGGADVKAVVGFHPRLATRRPDDSANIRGTVAGVRGHRGPARFGGGAARLRGRDASGWGGLEDEPLWRREAQLHSPGGGARRAPGGRV
jgi:dienelactone hydrolase